jgi:hypothetical protein
MLLSPIICVYMVNNGLRQCYHTDAALTKPPTKGWQHG